MDFSRRSLTSITFAILPVVCGVVSVTSVPLPARQQFEEYKEFEVVSLRRVRLPCDVLIQLNSGCETVPLPTASANAITGGRFEAMAQTPMELVRMAYLDESARTPLLSSGPSWVTSDRYDLIALTGRDGLQEDDPVVLDRGVRSMLRALLADRFQLRMKTVARQEPVNLLRRTDNTRLGANVRVATSVCDPPATFSLASGDGCVKFVGDTYQFRGVTMAGVAHILSRIALSASSRFVDETGLPGRYDLDLRASTDPSGGRGRSGLPPGAVVLRRPTAAELKSQLGLKLEVGERPVERLVIDRIERPRED